MDIEKDSKEVPALEKAQAKEENPVHTLLHEIRDTLILLDKALTNKETRTISRITKNVRKYRNVIRPHHLCAVLEALGWEVPSSLRTSPHFSSDFSEKLELGKNLITRVSKVLELECFVRILLVQIWWREESFDLCSSVVEDLLNRCTVANKRSLDQYTACLYHYWSRIEEKRAKD